MEVLLKKLEDFKERFLKIESFLHPSKKETRLRDLEKQINQDNFWQDNLRAIKISQEYDDLKKELDNFNLFRSEIKDLEDFLKVFKDSGETSVFNELQARFLDLEKKFSDLEFFLLFSEEQDAGSAILSIHAGTGGVDASDWAEILERMYLRFAERKNFRVEIIDRVVANEAGIKTSVLKISGPYAYGHLKSENGTHRLVRISPFDAEKMRHTSFAGVEVIPEFEEGEDFFIAEQDLRFEVFRSSGPGGQSVNTTDSAVRLTHLPSGLVVSCQSERSQHQNKEKALEILKFRLYQLEKKNLEEKISKIKGGAGKGTWGKQIRSYVFQPYQMVKDHRSGFSLNEIEEVLEGNLDPFIEAYLQFLLKAREL